MKNKKSWLWRIDNIFDILFVLLFCVGVLFYSLTHDEFFINCVIALFLALIFLELRFK